VLNSNHYQMSCSEIAKINGRADLRGKKARNYREVVFELFQNTERIFAATVSESLATSDQGAQFIEICVKVSDTARLHSQFTFVWYYFLHDAVNMSGKMLSQPSILLPKR
jgi:hypothetical protein